MDANLTLGFNEDNGNRITTPKHVRGVHLDTC